MLIQCDIVSGRSGTGTLSTSQYSRKPLEFNLGLPTLFLVKNINKRKILITIKP